MAPSVRSTSGFTVCENVARAIAVAIMRIIVATISCKIEYSELSRMTISNTMRKS
jgi:hypothetical protein